MDVLDGQAVAGKTARTRIVLPAQHGLFTFIPRGQILQILSADLFLMVTSLLCKELYLRRGVGTFWLISQLLFWSALVSALAMATRLHALRQNSVELSAIGILSVLMFMHLAAYMTALTRLPTSHVILLSHLFPRLLRFIVAEGGSPYQWFSCAIGLLLLSCSEFASSPQRWLGYVALAAHAVSYNSYEYALGTIRTSVSARDLHITSILGAAICGLPLYVVNHKTSSTNSWTSPGTIALSLAAAASLMIISPKVSRDTGTAHMRGPFVVTSLFRWCILHIFELSSGQSTWLELVWKSLLIYGLLPSNIQHQQLKSKSTFLRLSRSYIRRILTNPESSKMFYFLMLNLCYMLVQMLYGVWTNSLGLISDAIHMAFDCIAIAAGLMASVMATWTPDEQFTYGYGRIETLSGFANGVFLLLISLFIVFEAVERLLHPPDIDTSQLLVVSSLGLVVNLFGIFAMGGHHHGHSHSHSHSHAQPPTHSHSATHSHDHAGCSENAGAITTEQDQGHDPHRDHHKLERDESSLDGSLPAPDVLTTGAIPPSPITPAYRFGHDNHFEEHHRTNRVPNAHDHEHFHSGAHEGHSHNMRGVFLHILADTLGSVGVIISTLLIQRYGWTGFDPIASLFIAALIIVSVLPLVVDAGKVLALDVGRADAKLQMALMDLSAIQGVAGFTAARFWPKDSTSLIGSIHVQVVEGATERLDSIVEKVDDLLRRRVDGLEELAIQVEKL